MENASLNANLAKAFTGQPVEEQSVMDNPFPSIGPAPGQAQTHMPQTLAQTLPETSDFPNIARSMNLDVNGLHKNQQLGRLQLMDRLQKQFGPNFMQMEGVQKLLKAYASMPNEYGKDDERDLLSSTGKADRTLKAILGKL